MLGMSNEQLFGLLRQILPVIGGVLVTLGWAKPASVQLWSDTIMQAIGPAMIIGSAVWSLVSKTKANLVSTVAAMPEVKSVTLDPTKEGTADLNIVTPPNVKVGP